MVRITKITDYATVVASHLARWPDESHSAARISERLGIARPTVSKTLKLLARGGLLLTQRGAQGGYTLARAPQQISIADIIDAIEGLPRGLTECSSVPGACAQEPDCEIRGNWQKISLAVRRALASVTLADMVLPQSIAQPVVMLAPGQRPLSTARAVRNASARGPR